MRRCSVFALFVALAFVVIPAKSAEITDVIDAADDTDPFDLNIDVQFRSVLNQSKISHETRWLWEQDPLKNINQPDVDELRFEQQTYVMDAMLEIGLYRDLELYVNVPWIISDKKHVRHASGRNSTNSTVYRSSNTDGDYPGNLLATNPSEGLTSERAGIGDMQLGIKWAAFNQERDDTKSVLVLGVDLTFPTGKVVNPMDVLNSGKGGVGMGHYVITPFMLFSHRYKYVDPYVGIHGSIPIQGEKAESLGLISPYHGGFLTGVEIVPWENTKKHQKLFLDLRFTTEFFLRAANRGVASKLGTYNELSDFLAGGVDADPNLRQYQDTASYAQFGAHFSFNYQTGNVVRIRFGASLAHNSQHFITGASECLPGVVGECGSQEEINPYSVGHYDKPGTRLKVEETTIFTYWAMAMMTF